MNVTESSSHYKQLEEMSVAELLKSINQEDKTVPLAVEKAIPQIERLVQAVVQRMKNGGRLFYIGAGTSGRLGVVDASECPPTFGVSHDTVIGIIAGGDGAIRKAVEFAEDNTEQAWQDLNAHGINSRDTVIGVAASGFTPYVIGGLEACKRNNILTGGITCNPDSMLAQVAEYPVEVIVGPEFLTGSTRMKAGTAQKLALNMISTSVMIQLGKVRGNKMVDMQLSNHKLVARGVKMIVEELDIPAQEAGELLSKHGSVRNAIDEYKKNAGH
jgi:N-acetylmuramic acid 6-phosphate etherase